MTTEDALIGLMGVAVVANVAGKIIGKQSKKLAIGKKSSHLSHSGGKLKW